ncbi:nitroreductase family protein [Photobacterium sp. GJ3]|uniref:nitroreductase family protein n=1 Tax=Photobacterium sp. GJ3 TaxID=2829502 RepID=UPI001B8DA80A|nr:nitroreductase family protein [Photobacterium sp. GJ3]QUJ68204.1 nitroreductase family protein [Photobacterium sp. GJ3]
MKRIINCLKMIPDYFYDYRNYAKHSLHVGRYREEEHAFGLIIRIYHTIEKGLSITNKKPEFGLDSIHWLQNIIIENLSESERKNKHVQSAIITLKKYFEINKNDKNSQKYLFEEERFNRVVSGFYTGGINGGTKRLNVINNWVDYSTFFKNRSSTREFNTDVISDEDIKKIISIAKHCPSACNRQAIKIFYSTSLIKNKDILSLQNGSRTFRDKVPGVMIVCSDIRYQEGHEERNLGYIEGGIWVMSLINAMHSLNFGSCALNWCVSRKTDQKLKQLIDIPDYYQISALIAFGYPDKDQLVPYSLRKNSQDFMEEIK